MKTKYIKPTTDVFCLETSTILSVSVEVSEEKTDTGWNAPSNSFFDDEDSNE